MEQNCTRCEKPPELCICDSIRPIETRLHVLILQHPQEPDKALGSARLAHLSLPNSTLKVGLSWPNLKKALGRESSPSRWATLYLGSGIRPGSDPSPTPQHAKPGLHLVTKNGSPLPSSEEKKARAELEGIILLDGTWSQAKTLWWRNAWLLKTRRAILIPAQKSQYGNLRKEPRGECLSTVETAAEALTALGEPAATGDALRKLFGELLQRYRKHRSTSGVGGKASAKT